MIRDDQAAFLVALLKRPVAAGTLQPIGPQERHRILAAFLDARFDPTDPADRMFEELRKSVATAREYGAKAVDAIQRRQRSALLVRVVENKLSPLVAQSLPQFEREEGSVTTDLPSGRLKLPLNYGYVAETVVAAIGQAVIDEIVGGKSSGLCPYCKSWWISPDARRRRTCGKPECDLRRRAEWRKAHPEPAAVVGRRVRKWRKKNLKKKTAKKVNAKKLGRTTGSAAARGGRRRG